MSYLDAPTGALKCTPCDGLGYRKELRTIDGRPYSAYPTCIDCFGLGYVSHPTPPSEEAEA